MAAKRGISISGGGDIKPAAKPAWQRNNIKQRK